MADQYIDVPIEFDEDALYTRAIERIQTYFPNWSPRPGSFTDVLLRTCAMFAAADGEVASDVPSDIFMAFGSLANEPPLDGLQATADTTWEMQDDHGYTIPANTPVGLTSASVEDPVGFQVLDDVDIPNGSTTADVTIIAVDPGADSSNLDTIVRIDSLDFVTSITMTGVSEGGQDAELPDVYLTRLSQELETWTTTPILGKDFAILARKTVGVYRCAYLDNYNPADDTYGHEKMETLCPIDENGGDVGATIRAAVLSYMQSVREIGFVCHVVAPNYSSIDVAYTAHVSDPSLEAAVQTLINAALADFFNAANWGKPSPMTGEVPIWNNTPTIRLNKVIQTIEDVAGVDWADPVEIAIHGGALATANIDMPGPFPLPQLGTITPTMITG